MFGPVQNVLAKHFDMGPSEEGMELEINFYGKLTNVVPFSADAIFGGQKEKIICKNIYWLDKYKRE
jgi:hypothetical protein